MGQGRTSHKSTDDKHRRSGAIKKSNCGATLSANEAHDTLSETSRNPCKRPLVRNAMEEIFPEDIWIRQSFDIASASKEGLRLETKVVNGRRSAKEETKIITAPGTHKNSDVHFDKDLSVSDGLLDTDREESVIELLKSTKRDFDFLLFFLKFFDFLFDLNIIALSFICFHISYQVEKSRVSRRNELKLS